MNRIITALLIVALMCTMFSCAREGSIRTVWDDDEPVPVCYTPCEDYELPCYDLEDILNWVRCEGLEDVQIPNFPHYAPRLKSAWWGVFKSYLNHRTHYHKKYNKKWRYPRGVHWDQEGDCRELAFYAAAILRQCNYEGSIRIRIGIPKGGCDDKYHTWLCLEDEDIVIDCNNTYGIPYHICHGSHGVPTWYTYINWHGYDVPRRLCDE